MNMHMFTIMLNREFDFNIKDFRIKIDVLFICLLMQRAHYQICTRYNNTKCDNFTHLLFTRINVPMIMENN